MSETETQDQPEEVTEQYARIKTNYEEISELTNYIRMRGVDTDGQKIKLVTDTILYFQDDTVWAKAFDPMKSVWTWVRQDFDGIKQDGKLVIGSISDFRKYLNRFGEHTIVQQEEREDGVWLTFNDEDRKEGAYPATDEDHIKSVQNVEELPFQFEEGDDYPHAPAKGVELDTFFVTDVAEIDDVIEDGDTTQVRKYPLSVEDGVVSARVGDEDGYIETSFQASGEGTSASIYGYGMDNVFSNLTGEVTVFLMDDGPLWVHAEDEEKTLDYMIAQDEE